MEKFSPPLAWKISRDADGDFLEGLDAVGGKAGADDHEIAGPAAGKPGDGFGGIGLEPLGATEPRLESDDEAVRAEPRCLAKEARRLLAVAMIGIALLADRPRAAHGRRR